MKKYFTLLGLVLLLAGCASLGTESAQTFNDKLAYAVGAYTAVENTVKVAASRGTMSSTEGELILAQAEKAKLGLDVARDASKAGDLPGANDRLAAALIVLNALQDYLNSQGAKP